MSQKDILQTVLESDELPTLPTVASKLITLTSREDTTLSDIADLVSQDISLSAKILKVSNSSFYSFPQQIGSIKQAISILGTNAVRSLVLSFSFLSIKSSKDKDKFDFEKFWERALASAVASRLILEKVEGADTEEVFISGLLQNIGELIFARTFADKYEEVLTAVNDNQHDSLAAEESVFGVNHCFIGYEVAKNWGFPDVLLQPLLYHHDPSQFNGREKNLTDTVKAVYLSDLLTNILFSDKPEDYHKRFREEAKQLLNLTSDEIESIFQDVHIQIEKAGQYFGLKIKNPKSVNEILQEANVRLNLINLDYDQMNKQLIRAKIELENLAKELEEKNRILDSLANIDGLTEVYNHRYFQNALDQEINRSTRNDEMISLILSDIDHFKKFNDTYGHQIGDFILREFCATMKVILRQYDILARYGGEEFVIILPSTNEEGAYTAAEKLREEIDSTVFKLDGEEYHVTASFGVVTINPAAEEDFSKSWMIGNADEALYEAKKQGRNKVVSWSPKKKWYKL